MVDNNRNDHLKPKIVVPIGAAYYPLPVGSPTRKFAFILVPGFTLLAFSSAVEPLRIANQLSQQPLYQWALVSETGGAVHSSADIALCVDQALSSLARDVNVFVCAGNPQMAAATPGIVSELRRHVRFGGQVGGICTGAVALAQAGLLEDVAFTLHWENQPAFCEDFPDLTPTANKFEITEGVITCGGGAASTEMMLSLIARDHGPEFAMMVSEMCLQKVMVGVESAQRSSLSVVLRSRNPGLVKIVGLMNSHIEDPLPLEYLAKTIGYSRRHIERIFLSVLGETPADFYRGLRLDRGRNLLSTTDLPLIEVAMACGFSSVDHFSKGFRRRFGVAPTKYGLRRGAK